jgi:Ca2+-binding EF-hand superfamily protein
MGEVQLRLKEALAKQRTRIISLFREWDVDKSGTISKAEFRQVRARTLPESLRCSALSAAAAAPVPASGRGSMW